MPQSHTELLCPSSQHCTFPPPPFTLFSSLLSPASSPLFLCHSLSSLLISLSPPLTLPPYQSI